MLRRQEAHLGEARRGAKREKELAVGRLHPAQQAKALYDHGPGGDREHHQEQEEELVERPRLQDQRGHTCPDTGLQGSPKRWEHADPPCAAPGARTAAPALYSVNVAGSSLNRSTAFGTRTTRNATRSSGSRVVVRSGLAAAGRLPAVRALRACGGRGRPLAAD